MENLQIDNYEFRIKDMNALELLSFQSQISFDSYENTMNLYSLILTKIELKVNDKWLTVKQGDNFYPDRLKTDIDLMHSLIKYFMDYLKSVFQKSNESKE